MKQISKLCIAITTFLALVFSIQFTQHNHWYTFYSQYQGVSIEFPQISNDAVDADQLFEDLQFFSDTFQVNVMQFQFRVENGNEVVDIFASNLAFDDNFSFYEGSLPQGNYFISTHQEDLSPYHVGVLNMPLSNAIHARIFELSEARQFGIWRTFLLSDSQYTSYFVEMFSDYGEVIILEDGVGWLIPNAIGMTLALMGQNVLFIIITMLFITLLMLFLLSLQNKKREYLYILWGDSRIRALLHLPKHIALFQMKVVAITFMLLCIFLIYQGQLLFLIDYAKVFLIVQAVLGGIFFASVTILNFLIFEMSQMMTTMRGKKVSPKLSVFIFAIKSILTLFLVYLSMSSLLDWQIVTAQLQNDADWTRSEDVFSVSFHFDMGLLFRDVDHDFEMMMRFTEFYDQLREENGAFIMDSLNFPRFMYEDFGSDPFNHCFEEEFFYFGCNVITVDEAYLKRQVILTPAGENVLNFITDDVGTLNILVPIMHQHFEEEIIRYYLEGAGFFDINVIYTANGQAYFTYKNYTGNSSGEIIDPLVLVVNDSWHFTTIADLMTSSLFVIDTTHVGFDSLADARENHTLVELRSVESVYRQHEQHLQLIYTRFLRQSISLVAFVGLFIFFQFIMTWSLYQFQSYKLTLRHLFGDSYLRINKSIFIAVLSSYVSLTLTIYLLQQIGLQQHWQIERIFYFVFGLRFRIQLPMSVLVRGAMIFLLFELVLAYFIGKRQMKLNTQQTLKGEYI